MQSIDTYDFRGKKALIRVDFNVPLNDKFEITDDTRMRAAIPTIKKVLAGGGAVILMSHLGRPKNGPEDKFSLKHIQKHLEELTGVKVKFADDCIGESARKEAASLKPGEILLLENLRFYKEEEKGDEEFARKLADLGDVWINDAFGTAHRAHASTAVIAKFFPNDKLFGYVMKGELDAVDNVMKNPQRPFTAIMGGSKVSSKIDIIMNLMGKVDNLILGGGMTYTFKKALGGHVGSSICEEDKLELAREIMQKAKDAGVNLVLSDQAVVADAFSNDANTQVCDPMNIPDGWEGLDIGPATREKFARVIENSKTILWNGPVGVFEMPKFAEGTKAVADAIVKATEKGAFSLIGGGDSVAAINQFGLADKVSYVSTGGGALLEYIEGKKLPGIEAIRGE
ncbi:MULTISPECIES: phosphoglycerate kinase [Culturomica]|jgi:phosphoglycerate kinase|uniref:phosphoglycerate kinase n=1 Tax=Culturomica TaxID=1926651 RepID=UPI00033588DC|nr:MULTISPECIES: phosphoglycerate kinase [Odoribacteraceae]RHV93225.1 phosphoglycerate kinase [Odoribacter sp. OF09-27XD]CCZ07789.1 phosphoglycerate kinase [Odoribacter sp. CAG:788]HBO25587.1 phosphoglycerate kinase [Culturomica sp.]